jgi:hypothetical protein
MRPNSTEDPSIETVKELPDVGSFVILAPTPQWRIQSLNQLLGFQRYCPFGSLPYLIPETTDGLLLRVRIKGTLPGLATDLAFGKIKFPLPPLDDVAEELEAILDMD